VPKPKKVVISLKERMERMLHAGLLQRYAISDTEKIDSLPNRIKAILGIIRHKPQKATTMNYMIMYDIENNKVRRMISKYLQQQGCLRIQKSVFMANTEHPKFNSIYETLKDINSFYENTDSIILIPVNVSDARSMKLIGNNVSIDTLIDPPNTLFI
jgi:CRISPR-associated endonuclease Cas2